MQQGSKSCPSTLLDRRATASLKSRSGERHGLRAVEGGVDDAQGCRPWTYPPWSEGDREKWCQEPFLFSQGEMGGGNGS